MEKISKLIKSLNEDKLKNINLINFIENNPIISIERIERSWIVKGKSDRNWVYINCSYESELTAIMARLNKEDKCFAAIEDWMLPVLIEDKELLWDLSLTQFFLPDSITIPKSVHQTKPLSEEDAITVFENSVYKDFISEEYIKERIQKDISKGLYENDKLVGWGLTQDDGGLGFLHVIENARGKGYALSIAVSLIEEVRQKEKIPFAYIEKDNFRSINLVTKLGFVKLANRHWIEIK